MPRENNPKEEQNCKNCNYHDDFSGVCFNGRSVHRADFTDNDFVCKHWEKNDGQ